MSAPVRTMLEGLFEAMGGNSSVVALEYGSGGSTRHFSKFANKYFSVESEPNFFHDVHGAIAAFPNVKHELLPMQKEHTPGDTELLRKHVMYPAMQKIVHPRWRTDDYASYLLQATRFGPKHYNYVLIDGMARGQAAFMVLGMINERSRVVIHDFWATGERNVTSAWTCASC